MKTSSAMACLNDAQLIECIKEGSNPAMEQLMERHSSHLKAYLHSLLRNSAWEEDALQNLWIKVLLEVRNNRYRESGRFAHWLDCLAKTAAFNILRSEKHYLHDDKKLRGQEQEQAEVRPDGNDDEEETARSGYNSLQACDKEIVDKHYRGWSFGEIGMDKGMKENTARARYSRAMKRIRKYITKMGMKKRTGELSKHPG